MIDRLPFLFQNPAKSRIFTQTIRNRVLFEISYYFCHVIKVLFPSRIKSTVKQFRNGYFRDFAIQLSYLAKMFNHRSFFLYEGDAYAGVKQIFSVSQHSYQVSTVLLFTTPLRNSSAISIGVPLPPQSSWNFANDSSTQASSLASSTDSAKDSVKNMMTIFLSSRLIPCNNPEYGAIGVSKNFLATAVISSICFLAAKVTIISE